MTDVDALLDEALQELDTRTYLTIDPVTRVVNTNGKLLLGVESDEESNRVWFKCPRIVGDNFDLTTGHIRVNYENANKFRNSYLVEDVTVDGDNVIFSWKLSREVTIFKGTVKFIVCVKKADSEGVLQNEWNTTLATGDVLEGLETTQQIVEENYDILEQILIKVDELNVSIEDAVNNYLDENPVQAYDLPIATPTTLGGVKPIAKTDEMTQEVGVDELGGLFTKEGGSSGMQEYTLMDITTTEEVNFIAEALTEEFITHWGNAKFIRIYAKLCRPSVYEGLKTSPVTGFGIYSNQNGTGGWFISLFPIRNSNDVGLGYIKLSVPMESYNDYTDYNCVIPVQDIYGPQGALWVCSPKNNGPSTYRSVLSGYKNVVTDNVNNKCVSLISTNPIGVGTKIVIKAIY